MQTLDTFVLSCLLAFMAYFVLRHEIAKCERHQKAGDACGCALHPKRFSEALADRFEARERFRIFIFCDFFSLWVGGVGAE